MSDKAKAKWGTFDNPWNGFNLDFNPMILFIGLSQQDAHADCNINLIYKFLIIGKHCDGNRNLTN